jgi:hypothetical protein
MIQLSLTEQEIKDLIAALEFKISFIQSGTKNPEDDVEIQRLWNLANVLTLKL